MLSIENQFIMSVLSSQTIPQIRRLAAKHQGHEEEDCLGCYAIRYLQKYDAYCAGNGALWMLPDGMLDDIERRAEAAMERYYLHGEME